MAAISASQSRAADSTSVLSTALRSKVERLMIFSTSAVAACCCRLSRSSLSRRAFSIAMTAWLAIKADAIAVADNEHPDHQLRIDRGPPDAAVERRHFPREIP